MSTAQSDPPVRASPKTPRHPVTPKASARHSNITPSSVARTPAKTAPKRVAIQSPSISPHKDSPVLVTRVSVDTGVPERVPPQASRQVKFTKLSTGEVKRRLDCEEWKQDWEHPQILQELLSDPVPPTAAEILPYEFDLDDPTTYNLLRLINGVLVGEHMRDHVLSVKKPEASRMHPRFGPFTLLALDRDNTKFGVFNKKNDRAFTFKLDDFKLDLDGTHFDLDDATTYTLLCTLRPDLLWEDIREARNSNNPILQDDKGPFQILINNDNGKKLLFRNKDGNTWSSNLDPDSLTPDTSQLPSETQQTNTDSHLNAPSLSHEKATTNRFEILLDQRNGSDTPDAMSLDSAHNSPSRTAPSQDQTQHEYHSIGEKDMDIDSNTQPAQVNITMHEYQWNEEDSDNDAACSGDEKAPRPINLKDIYAKTLEQFPSTQPSPQIAGPHLSTTPSLIDVKNGEHLLTVEIQLQPGKEHLDVLLHETKSILAYIQQVDPTAKFVSKTIRPDGTPYPPLTSPKDKMWPTTFLAAQNWYQTSMGYLFQQDPITEAQLATRLDNRRNKSSSTSRSQTKKVNSLSENGPVSMYATVNLFTSITNLGKLLEAINIDLRRSKVKLSLKDLQCWDSYPKKMMCGVNSTLCVAGVQQLLSHRLKELEKKMCRHGRLNTMDWYDVPLPELKVTLRPIRPLKLPNNEEEKARLSFDPFPWESKLVYFLEASDNDWFRLDPLLQLFVETNDITKTFGPSAYIMDVPDNKPSIGKVISYHTIGRISMGYNLKTTILECSEVQLYDYEVKVAMEEIEETSPSGLVRKIKPKPPYAKTTLRKELQRIRVNGDQVFHTAVMTCTGLETGTSRIVIADDPSDPLRTQKYEFAKKTVSNLACFMYHWLISCGYNSSTRTRLMRSFYVEKAQLAEYSTWDPISNTATSHFASRSSTYIENNAKYDPGSLISKQKRQKTSTQVIDISTSVRSQLLKTLGVRPGETFQDVVSQVSGVSPHTGEGSMSCDSTVNSTNTANVVMKTKDFALQLAASKAKQADQEILLAQARTTQEEQEAIIRTLRQQMEALQQTNKSAEFQTQQGAPTLVEAESPPPQDPGGGETLQGP